MIYLRHCVESTVAGHPTRVQKLTPEIQGSSITGGGGHYLRGTVAQQCQRLRHYGRDIPSMIGISTFENDKKSRDGRHSGRTK